MSRTVYVKFTLKNDWEFAWIKYSLFDDSNVTVWNTLSDMMADEIDFESLLGKAIDESADAFESWNVGTQSEDPPTVAGTLIDLLKNGVYDGK